MNLDQYLPQRCFNTLYPQSPSGHLLEMPRWQSARMQDATGGCLPIVADCVGLRIILNYERTPSTHFK